MNHMKCIRPWAVDITIFTDVPVKGCDLVSRTNFNQIHVLRILETAKFTNHMSFLAIFTHHGLSFSLPYFHASRSNFCPIFTRHGQMFALFSRVTVKFLPFSRSRINRLPPSRYFPRMAAFVRVLDSFAYFLGVIFRIHRVEKVRMCFHNYLSQLSFSNNKLVW